MRRKIHAIIFDYGGVLTHPQDNAKKRAMIKILGLDDPEFTRSYFQYRDQYDLGLMTGETYWTHICTDHTITLEREKIATLIQLDVQSWTMINDTMLELVSTLQASTMKTALLSNMTHDILLYVRKTCAWLNGFHTCIFSCEHNVTKPHKEIYHICLQSLDEDAANCLFIDDSAVNVQAAQDIGINIIHFQGQHDLITKLNNYLPKT